MMICLCHWTGPMPVKEEHQSRLEYKGELAPKEEDDFLVLNENIEVDKPRDNTNKNFLATYHPRIPR